MSSVFEPDYVLALRLRKDREIEPLALALGPAVKECITGTLVVDGRTVRPEELDKAMCTAGTVAEVMNSVRASRGAALRAAGLCIDEDDDEAVAA